MPTDIEHVEQMDGAECRRDCSMASAWCMPEFMNQVGTIRADRSTLRPDCMLLVMTQLQSIGYRTTSQSYMDFLISINGHSPPSTVGT